MTPIPAWRSLLFVPADKPALLEKAHMRGADAIILDLEDAVPAAGKPQARADLGNWIERLAGCGCSVVVRVNSGWLDVLADLPAVIRPGVSALLLPQVKDDLPVRAVSGIVAEMETAQGLPEGNIGLIPMVEGAAVLPHLPTIAALPRVVGLALGSEDYALSLRSEPGPAVLTPVCQTMAQITSVRGQMAIGLVDSLTNFRDLDAYGRSCAQSRAVGMTGALCIHPAQVEVVNQSFAISPALLAWADKVMNAWKLAEAQGLGVCSVDGQMIDRPVVERARHILKQG